MLDTISKQKNEPLDVKLVSYYETSELELMVTMRCGKEVKQVTLVPSYLDDLFQNTYEYYVGQEGWSEKHLEHYWHNGGREKEIAGYVDLLIDHFSDPNNWDDLSIKEAW